MAARTRLSGALRAVFRRRQLEQELDDELRAYLEAAIEEKVTRGASRAVAEREARAEIGSVAAVKDYTRDVGWESLAASIVQDVRYSVRGLRRSPGFAAAVVLTLGLGVGVNTAIFSVADAALFKPLPYENPGDLVELKYVFRRGTPEETAQLGLPWRQLDGWRAQTQLFKGVEMYGTPRAAAVNADTSSAATPVSRMSPGLMALLGLSPVLGRGFGLDDVRPEPDVVMVGQRFWETRLDQDPEIIGRPITIDDRQYTVVGVVPATLSWRVNGRNVAAWLPLDEVSEARRGPFVGAVARLQPHLTLEQADDELDRAAAALDVISPDTLLRDVDLVPIEEVGGPPWLVQSMLEVTLGAVGIVLIIACANVANLLLARNLTRHREIALRTALGATWSRQMRRMLTEGLVLATAGGVVGIVFVTASTRLLPRFIPEEFALFEANLLAFDLRTFAVASLSIVATGVICSVLPAVRILRTDRGAAAVMPDPSRMIGPGRSGRRLQLVFQAIQVALALVLLSGASLLAASFLRMAWAEAGYDVDRLATVSIASTAENDEERARQDALIDDLLVRLNGLPGVRAARGQPPVSAMHGRFVAFGRENEDHGPGLNVDSFSIGEGYLGVTGIPLRVGRALTAQDCTDGASVALIDERAARRFWPGESALGQRFRYSPHMPWLTVVGVVGHVKTRSFAESERAMQVYVPAVWSGTAVNRNLLIRGAGDAASTLRLVGRLARESAPSLTVADAQVVSAMYDPAFVLPRFALFLMSLFAGLALMTACVGLYGVLAYAVNQRTSEIGIRMALGASARQVRRLILRDAFLSVGLGFTGGLITTFVLSRSITSLLYQTQPTDPWAFVVVSTILAAVGALASWMPVRRATRVDPAVTLWVE